MIARSLNSAGIARFRAYLAQLRAAGTGEPPRELLEDEVHTTELEAEIAFEDEAFASRRALGAYLCKVLAPIPLEELDRDVGLWTWLSLYWFDQICPRGADGTRRPGRDTRHVPFESWRRFEHLIYGPYLVYRRHGPVSLVLLSGPVHRESRIYAAITRNQNLLANRGVLEAALRLYVDPKSAALKPGCQPAEPRPGTIRRFVRVLEQLDVTYDVFGMSGREILGVLPREFDAWRSADERS